MIKEVLEHYHPAWEPPPDEGGWNKCECPVHYDENPSASVNYKLGAFKCHGCGYKGDWIAIIEREEDCSYGEAIRIAEGIAQECGVEVPRSTPGKPRRGVPKPARFKPL